jgi:hypothetical protein
VTDIPQHKLTLCDDFQVLGRCPTVSIDKTDGFIVYLSKDSLGCEIVSAKSSEMNVAIPPKDGGDYVSLTTVVLSATIWALLTDVMGYIVMITFSIFVLVC